MSVYGFVTVVLAPVFGIIGPFMACDRLQNNKKKLAFLREYTERGLEVPGLVEALTVAEVLLGFSHASLRGGGCGACRA